MRFEFLSSLTIALAVCCCAAASAQDRGRLLTGQKLQAELDRPIAIARDSIAQEGAELRPFLQRLASERGIALALDRRVDPSLRVDPHIPPLRFRDALTQIASAADSVCILAGDTMFIGPKTGVNTLRTLIALRTAELEEKGSPPEERVVELQRAWTFVWDDLDRPSDLLLLAAQHWALQVEGLDLVPHDLWAAGTLAGVNSVDALSLLLIQYDLTFEWIGNQTGMRIVPIPDRVAIMRTHNVRGITPARALERARAHFPDLDLRIQGRELVASAAVEEHEILARLARGEAPDEPAPKPVDFGPLRRRKFEIRVASRSVAAVLQTLAGNGVDVRYDPDQLAEHGIDLSQTVSFEFRNATVEDVFEAICEPVGLRFTLEGETVTLSPR